MTVKVEVYSTTYCPYCRAAESLLDGKNIPYEAYDVTGDDAKRQWLVETTGQRTVPQIFIDERPIGGFQELRALNLSGELDALLQSA